MFLETLGSVDMLSIWLGSWSGIFKHPRHKHELRNVDWRGRKRQISGGICCAQWRLSEESQQYSNEIEIHVAVLYDSVAVCVFGEVKEKFCSDTMRGFTELSNHYRIPILDTSGKINKKELPPVRGFSEEDVNVENFSNQLTRTLATIWCRILKISSLDATDNFFDLGGWVTPRSEPNALHSVNKIFRSDTHY